MGTKDIKLHYGREWQAITDVHVWRYQYSSLIKDVMKTFLPTATVVPTFKVQCEVNGQYVSVYDNESLSRCLLFGEDEIDIYISIVNESKNGGSDYSYDAPKYNVNGVFNSGRGYFVEEVEDEEEPEVVILDSESDDVEEMDESVEEDIEFDSEDEDINVDDSFEKDIDIDSEDEVELSLDDDDEYNNDEDAHSDSMTSLEEENVDFGTEEEDRLDEIDSDVEIDVPDVTIEPEMEEQWQNHRKENAGFVFRKNDDGKIHLRKGHLFSNVNHFRSVLRDFVIQEGFELIRHKNEKARVTVSCKANGCTWRLHASPTADGVTYKIKTYNDEHNCLRKSRFREATSEWIASHLYFKFAADPNKPRKAIERDLIDAYGISGLSDMKLYRARQKAKEKIHGDHREQYAKLHAYGELLMKHNPGSIFKVTPIERQTINCPIMFKRLFVVFEGVKQAFLEGCRPFLGLDGCFLKGPYGGIFLCAVALDGNNGKLPIAAGVAESECRDSWTYFLTLLKDAIGPDLEGIPWTMISDRQKGLTDAIAHIFPTSIQRYCLWHIEANFKLKFKEADLTDKLREAGRACDARSFQAAMEYIKKENPDAYKWLEHIPAHLWSRHAYNPVAKVDHVTNSISESFNHWIGNHRDLPILTMLEEYRLKVMKMLHSRFQAASKWSGKLVPNTVKKLNKEWNFARRFDIIEAGHGEYQCKDGGLLRVVNLNLWTCDCGRWLVTGIPCRHAMACIRSHGHEVEAYCHSSFSVRTYFKVYNHIIHPQPDVGVLPMPQENVMLPPPLKRLPGRPRKARRIHLSEKLCTQRSTVIRCSNCKEIGHNIRGCQKAPTAAANRMRSSNQNSQGASSSNQSAGRSQTEKRTMRPKLGIRSKAKRGRI